MALLYSCAAVETLGKYVVKLGKLYALISQDQLN